MQKIETSQCSDFLREDQNRTKNTLLDELDWLAAQKAIVIIQFLAYFCDSCIKPLLKSLSDDENNLSYIPCQYKPIMRMWA